MFESLVGLTAAIQEARRAAGCNRSTEPLPGLFCFVRYFAVPANAAIAARPGPAIPGEFSGACEVRWRRAPGHAFLNIDEKRTVLSFWPSASEFWASS